MGVFLFCGNKDSVKKKLIGGFTVTILCNLTSIVQNHQFKSITSHEKINRLPRNCISIFC